VTGLVRAELHQRMLIDELNHRVKNMLTVVLTLVEQTAVGAISLDMFKERYTGRLKALSATYGLLSREQWKAIGLAELLEEEIRPFRTSDGDNVTLQGTALALKPGAALVLGMASHELVTNAVKYGALSSPQGRIAIAWTVQDSRFVLDWTETGGPAAQAPPALGFGMTLIRRSVEHELEGRVDFTFGDEGLRMRMEAPLASLIAQPEATE